MECVDLGLKVTSRGTKTFSLNLRYRTAVDAKPDLSRFQAVPILNRSMPGYFTAFANKIAALWRAMARVTPSLFNGTLNVPMISDVLQLDGAMTATLTARGRATVTLTIGFGARDADVLASIGNYPVNAVYDVGKP